MTNRRFGLPRLPSAIAAGLAIVAVWASPSAANAQALPTDDQCLQCHLGLDEDRLRRPAESFAEDVHGALGFDCLSCHGRTGDGPGGLNPDRGFLASPTRAEIPELCGRCHSDAAFMRSYNPSLRVDQVTEYWTSGHGRGLAERGDPNVATCVSCHPAHGTLPPTNPESTVHPLNVADLCAGCHADSNRMGGRSEGTAQAEEYRNSVHGQLLFEEGDLSAPTCNDCHGNHGAAPPGISSVRNVCGQCHATMADFFASSGHPDLFDDVDLPGCAACHEHHSVEATSDELLTQRSETVCAQCHEPGDPDGDAFRVMKALIDSLVMEADESRDVLMEAENLGMEVEQALFDLDEVGNALVKARTAIHAFRVDPVQEEIEAGLTATVAALSEGEDALFEHWFRRAGLAAFAAVILGLVFALILRIRHIEIRAEELVSGVDSFFREAVLAGRTRGEPMHAEAIRLAACGLLLELAWADDEFTPAEFKHLEDLIQRRFGLDPDEASRLIELARTERESGTDLKEFTALISRHFSVEEKHELVNAMWGLVLSDGELAEHERRLMREITQQLGLGGSPIPATEPGPARRWMRMFFDAMGERWRGGDAEEAHDLHMAACALLVEIVYADEEFLDLERAQLERILERQFGLSRTQAVRLISLTEEHRAAGFDIEVLGDVVRAHYGPADKQRLVDAMWSLVMADGKLARREQELMDRILALLHVDPAHAASEAAGKDTSTPGGSS